MKYVEKLLTDRLMSLEMAGSKYIRKGGNPKSPVYKDNREACKEMEKFKKIVQVEKSDRQDA